LIHAQTAGSRVKKRVERTLPETSALIAAELSAGSSVEDALLQAAQLPGPLAEILGRAVDQAANAGRPLTSRGTQIGMLREVLSGMGLPALRGFAVQLDSVAQSGVESGERMGEIASTLAAEYRQRIRDSIKTLDKKLTLAVSAFYFAPFFLILLMGTFGAALSSF
jgi:tight adherence protein C